jgi:hypothetical protein
VRRQFNELVGNIFDAISPDEVDYKFNVKKRDYSTCICGDGFKEFISDYGMEAGDRVKFGLDNAPHFFRIVPEAPDGTQKLRIQGAVLSSVTSFFNFESCFSDFCLIHYIFLFLHGSFIGSQGEICEDDARVIVYTGGLRLTTDQIARKNQLLAERTLGMGAVFVHKFTNTDIYHNGLV